MSDVNKILSQELNVVKPQLINFVSDTDDSVHRLAMLDPVALKRRDLATPLKAKSRRQHERVEGNF